MSIRPVLVTADLERLRRFYVGVLGATEKDRTPAEGPVFYLGLEVDGTDLGLVADSDAPGDGAPQRFLLSVEVPAVDPLLDTVTELGGTVLGPPNDMPWGQRVAHVRDPDGNAVNLAGPTSG